MNQNNPTGAAKMGRPAIHEKPLKRTFTIDLETEAILTEVGKHMRCSRSDALVTAVHEWYNAWKRR